MKTAPVWLPLLYDDPDHSEDEERFLLVGVSVALRALVVVHCIREEGRDDEVIRIISARRPHAACFHPDSDALNFTGRASPLPGS